MDSALIVDNGGEAYLNTAKNKLALKTAKKTFLIIASFTLFVVSQIHY